MGNRLGTTKAITPLAQMMDSVGLQLGKSRISLLDVTSVAAIGVGLFGAVRLANRVLARSISRSRGLDATQKLLAEKLAGIAIIAAAFFFGIDVLGIDLTAFAVFSGALGLWCGRCRSLLALHWPPRRPSPSHTSSTTYKGQQHWLLL